MGAGYNIPISLSAAQSTALNPVFGGNSQINFSSPFSGMSNDPVTRADTQATATSSAAQRDAFASATPTLAGEMETGTGASVSPWIWVAIGGLIITTGVIVWVYSSNR